MEKFKELNQEIYNFVKSANTQLPYEDRIYYSCNFISGKLENPKYLFVGLNPGYGEPWKNRPSLTFKPWIPIPIGEYYLKNSLEELYGSEILKTCALINLHPIATPDGEILDTQTQKLCELGLGKQYEEIKRKILGTVIEQVKPKEIVCIGVQTFDIFAKIYKLKIEVAKKRSNGHRLYLRSARKENFPNVHGVVHLTGARPPLDSNEKEVLKNCLNGENNG